MLGFIRKHSGSIWVKVGLCVVASTFLFFFGMSDVINKITGKDYIIKVGKVKIGPNLFKFEIQKRAENLKKIGVNDEEQLINIVIHQIISEEIMRQMSDKFGLLISDDAVKMYMYGVPMFRDKNGMFNKAAVRNMMMNMHMREADFIEYMRQDLRNKLLMLPLSMCQSNLLATNYIVTSLENRDIRYVHIPYNRFAIDVQHTDDDLEECYKANVSEFMLPETRDFTVLLIKEQDILRDITISDDDVMSEYKARSETDDFETVKDEIHASLVNSELEDRIDKLVRLIEDDFTAGLSCSEIAEKYKLQKSDFKKITQDYQSPANSTTSLPFMDDVMKAAFALELNQESSFVEATDRNNQKVRWLVHNDSITPAHPKELSEVKDKVIKIWQTEKQKEAAKAFAQGCVDTINTGVTIDYVVEKHGYTTKEINGVSRFDKPSDKKFEKYKFISDELISSVFTVANLHASMSEDKEGYTVFEVIKVYTPENIDEKLTHEQHRRFLINYKQELLLQLKQHYAKNAGIKVNTELLKSHGSEHIPDVDF